jgi:SAM-dependent methyltransferase
MHAAIRTACKRVLTAFPRWQREREFNTQRFIRFNERPAELRFLFSCFLRLYPRKVLDVGTGLTALPSMLRLCGSEVTAIDNVRDYWPRGMMNLHYHVINDDICNPRLQGQYDLITCVSVLEHIEKCDAAVENMFHLLRPGGCLMMSFPYTERRYIRNVYELPGSSYGQNEPYITQSFSRNELDHWMEKSHGAILEQEFWQFWDGDFWTAGRQLLPPKMVDVDGQHQLTCLLIRKEG